ncbi:hypothetical protein ABT124_43325 [Streptomyces sp. NPDC001982]|uniref:hypothetical protein n=1 Tax=Streptomyces sp. NPDC001982 TaxID=3154405 RepID=UPI003332F9A9
MTLRLCVVKWAQDALDEVRRQVWNDARRVGMKALASQLKDSRYIRRAYGFRSVEALRAMILLCLAGCARPLPGRS